MNERLPITGFEPPSCIECLKHVNGDTATPSSAGCIDPALVQRALDRPRVSARFMNNGHILTEAMTGNAARLRTTVEASYNETAGRDEVLFKHLERNLAVNATAVGGEIAGHERALKGTDSHIEVPGEGTPWTLGSIAKVISLAGVSLVLLLVGMLAVGTILINSGVAGFEPGTVWPYLFSAIPAASSWGIKCWTMGLALQVWRRRLMVTILVAGVLLAMLWSFLFVHTFGGGMTASLSDVVNSVVAGATGQSGGSTGKWLLFVGLVAESLLAGGLFMAIDLVCERHHAPKKVPNGRHTPVHAALLKCRAKESEIAELLGLVRSRLSEISDGRVAYVGQAMSLYDAARETLAHRAQISEMLNTLGLLPTSAKPTDSSPK
jgi:hypothetical protein